MMAPFMVAIVGSFRRHYPEVLSVAEKFRAAGATITTPPVSSIINAGADFVRFESDPRSSSDQQLQKGALAKILSSDLVYVVNPGGYVGRTTAYELGRVQERGMALYFAEQPMDLPIEVSREFIVSAGQLAELLVGGVQVGPVRRPRISALLTADLAIFTIREQRLHALLVKRGRPPFKGQLALPGGFVRPGEALEDAAVRELAEETGLDGSRLSLRQVRTYSAPRRDPRGRVIATAFLAIATNLPEAAAEDSSDAAQADWIEVEHTLGDRLAFDHGQVLDDALEQARTLLEYTTIAVDFCAPEFTIGELRQVYEAVWGIELNAQNFHRKVRTADGFVENVGKKRNSHLGRPAELFRRGPAKVLSSPMMRTKKSRHS